MLADVIVQRWREAVAVRERVRTITPEQVGEARAFFDQLTTLTPDEMRKTLAVRTIAPEQVGEARAFFDQLTTLTPDEVRKTLAKSDVRGTKGNRDLAWLLFCDTLDLDIATDFGHALNLLDWAKFVAGYSYGGEIGVRQDALEAHCLEAHCEFYRGVLQHYAGDLTKAQLSYMRAEAGYRDAGASSMLQGLSIYAQGAVAHEADNVEGTLSGYSAGSRERFQQALEILSRAGPQEVVDEVQALINLATRQRELVDKLLTSDQPASVLNDQHEIVDPNLLELLRSRIRFIAVNDQPASKVVSAAYLADMVADRLGKTTHSVDDLLAYYIDSKQLDTAESILHEQVKARPSDVKLRKTLAYVLFQQAKYTEARSVLEDVLEHNSDDVEMLTMLGMALLGLDDLANASTYLQRALTLDPDNTLAAETLQEVGSLARSSLRDGTLTNDETSQLSSHDNAAGMVAMTLLDANPDTVEAILEEIAESDPELARKAASLLQEQGLPISQPPQSARQHFERAEHFFQQGRWQEAVEAYRLATEADPNMSEAYMGWGDVYYRRGEYYLAIAYFEEAIAIEPNPSTYRFLADALRHIGKPKQAITAYRQALELDPNYAGAREALQDLLKGGIEDEEAGPPN